MADTTIEDLTSSATSLADLPAETVERIAELSSRSDLLALRLVDRGMSSKVFRTFVKVHFTDRGFLLCNEASLRTLANIVEHETFGKVLRTVALYDNELPEDVDDVLLERWAEDTGTDTGAIAVAYDELHDTQRRFQDSSAQWDLLKSILKRLKAFDTPIKLEILDIYVIHTKRYPMTFGAVAGNLDIFSDVMYQDAVGCGRGIGSWNPVFKALASTLLSPYSLTVDDTHWQNFLVDPYYMTEGSSAEMLEHAAQVFTALKHFKMVDVHWHSAPDERLLNPMSKLFAAAQALETLTLV